MKNTLDSIQPWRLVKRQPIKPGHYWYRLDDQHELVVFEVYRDKGSGIMCVRTGHGPSDYNNFLENHPGEWAGPIPRPRNEHVDI